MTNETRGASPEQLEHDIAVTRMEIDSTLEAIQEKLSPGQILDQALRYTKDNGGQFAGNIGRSVRDNPIPLALVGIGLSWLMVSGNRNDAESPYRAQTRDVDPSSRDRVASGTDAARERVVTASEAVEGKASELAGAGRQKLREARDTAEQYGEAAKSRLESVRSHTTDAARSARDGIYSTTDSAVRFFEEHPLVFGALAVAAGAALAAIIPPTRRESEFMGDESTRLREAAKEEAQETVRSVKTVARAAKAGVKKGVKTASEVDGREAGASSTNGKTPTANRPASTDTGSASPDGKAP